MKNRIRALAVVICLGFVVLLGRIGWLVVTHQEPEVDYPNPDGSWELWVDDGDSYEFASIVVVCDDWVMDGQLIYNEQMTTVTALEDFAVMANVPVDIREGVVVSINGHEGPWASFVRGEETFEVPSGSTIYWNCEDCHNND